MIIGNIMSVPSPVRMIIDALFIHRCHYTAQLSLIGKRGEVKLGAKVNLALSCRIIPAVRLGPILRNETKVSIYEATCRDTFLKSHSLSS